MEIDEYLFRQKLTHKQFAKKIGVDPVTVNRLKHFHGVPNLITAMKVFRETRGAVSFMEMLSPATRTEYEI